MPAERVSMRRVREILRLKHACGSSDRAIARSLGIARSTVALTLERLAAAGPAWPLPEALSDRVLEGMLYAGTGARQGLRRKGEPDWTRVHRELRRAGVTLMLLWEEYRAAEPDGYVSGCETSLARPITSIAFGRAHGSNGGRWPGLARPHSCAKRSRTISS